jgi:hypothetical protein
MTPNVALELILTLNKSLLINSNKPLSNSTLKGFSSNTTILDSSYRLNFVNYS